MTAQVETLGAGWSAGCDRPRPSLAWLLRSVLSLLVAVGILAVALPAAFGSGAKGGVDPVEVFSSGSLISVEAGGSAQLSVDGMVPGQSRSATIRVASEGSAAALGLAAHFVDRVGSGGAPLSRAIRLRITPLGDAAAPLYAGSLARMPRLALGHLGPGAERAYRFTVVLPSSVGNEVAGSSLSAGFAWNAA